MPEQYEIVRASDATLIRLAIDLLQGSQGTAEFRAGDVFSFSVTASTELSDDVIKAFSTRSYLIKNGTILVPTTKFKFEFRRGMVYRLIPHQGMQWHSAPPFVDGIEITAPHASSATEYFQLLTRHLAFAPTLDAELTDSPLERASLILDRLSDAAAQVIEHTSERQRELDAHIRKLDRDAKQRIASERSQLVTEHDEKLKVIQAREEELDVFAKSLDDRANTHVRRELQKNMAALSTNILERPLLTSSQKSFSRLELISAGFAFLLLGLATFQSGLLTTSKASGPLLWFGEARVVLLGLGAGALIWYALRQSAARYRQVSRWENDLNRFRLDTERASFLIEGDLEARNLSDSGLPDVMLDRFSRGLFTGGSHETSHDGEDVGATLGHLFNRAALVKLGTDGVNIEVKGSGIRKAQKDADKDATDPSA